MLKHVDIANNSFFKEKSSKFLEIQSLRAISVIVVIGYHYFENIFINGYIGVDIFFVISGFVISKSLNEKFQKNSFRLFILNFFYKRIKRILPVLVTVVLTSSFLFYFLNLLHLAKL